MRYRFAVLTLLVVLPVPFLSAAPAPQTKWPSVYALVYVGGGHNDAKDAKRVAEAVRMFWSGGMEIWGDKEVSNLPIVKNQKLDGFPAWLRENLRVRALEGTAVLRIWFIAGTPEEQAAIINVAVRHYVQESRRQRAKLQKILDAQEVQRQVHLDQNPADMNRLRQLDESIRRAKEALQYDLPRPLELASAIKDSP